MKSSFVFCFILVFLSGFSHSKAIDDHQCPADIDDYLLIEKLVNVDGASQGLMGAPSNAFVEGFALFIQQRAQAELRLWVMDELRENLCDEEISRYFPNSCNSSLEDTKGRGVLGINNSYDVLAQQLRKDMDILPGCLLERTYKTTIGYFLSSLYQQVRGGYDPSLLIYDMANRSEIFSPDVCNSESSLGCNLAISIIFYASALESEANNDDVDQFMERAQQKLYKCQNVAEWCDPFIRAANNLEEYTGRGQFDRFAQISDQLDRMRNDLEKEKWSLNREELVDRLLAIGRLIGVQLNMFSGENSFHLQNAQALFNTYTHTQSGEYKSAYIELRKLRVNDDLSKLDRIAFGVASLAEAKDKGEFSERLDELASPVGAWKWKHDRNMYVLNAFGGLSFRSENYSIDNNIGDVRSENSVGIFAPVGLHFSWSDGNGLFISVLDFGNIINSPKDVELESNGHRGKIKGEVNSSLGNIISPGIYYTYAPTRKSPFVLGFGGAYGPSTYRKFEDENGNSFDVSREWSAHLFLALDIVIFRLR